jgi:putative peptidoglycan lipid II flippase
MRSSAIVGLGTFLSRVTGYLRVAAIAYALGVTALAGTYSYANETPNMLYELLLGGVLTATLVPVFVSHLQRRDDDAASAIVTCSLLLVIALTVVGVVLAPQIVELYTLRVSGPNKAEQQELATALMRCFLPQMLFYAFTALATALLQARSRFAAAAFAPILNNLVVISIFVALPQIAGRPLTIDRVKDDTGLVLLLGLGTTAGVVAMALALVPALGRAGVRLRFLPAWRSAAVRTMLRLSSWSVGYVIANQIALWVVLVLANEEAGGAFAYLSAYTFFQLPHGLFAVSIITTVAPELAAAGTQDNAPALRHRFARALRLMLTVIIPAAALYLALARPIVAALLQRGAFTSEDASIVADTLLGFAVGLPFFSTYLFALRAFYSVQNTRTPFYLNCLENAINIALAFPLFAWLGIPGLALAFSVAYIVTTPVTLAALGRRIGGLRGRGIGLSALRVLVASAAGGGVAWVIGRAIGSSTSAEAIAATVAGALGGFVVIVGAMSLLRVDEFVEVRDMFDGRFRRSAGQRAAEV